MDGKEKIPMYKEVAIISTHFVNSYCVNKYRVLCTDLRKELYDVVLLINLESGDSWEIANDITFKMNDSASINALGYNPIEEEMLPGSCHFPLLRFYIDNPSYKFYWFIEYDVVFTGNWSVFMNDCRDNLSDYDRVIAATNEDIEKAVNEGRFRFDLWQRVDEYTLEVPSLGDCPEDVLPLAEELLKRFNTEFHKSVEGFSDEAKEKLQSHSWPGNIRELKNVIRCAVVENTGGLIDAEHLKFKAVPQKENTLALKDDDEERHKIERALIKAGHNLTKAAEILGISRPTLYKKMEAYSLK